MKGKQCSKARLFFRSYSKRFEAKYVSGAPGMLCFRFKCYSFPVFLYSLLRIENHESKNIDSKKFSNLCQMFSVWYHGEAGKDRKGLLIFWQAGNYWWNSA